MCRPLPTVPMSESHLLQHPRHRFVAFSAVGVLMVCLPLWQVLQYQQADLQHLAAERALLDPVTRAVHVQFGLLAHRQVSAQLLQGQPQLEAARQAVQVGVDEQLQALSQELKQGLWSHAAAETRDLSNDWQALAQRVKARSLTAARSDEAHALRIEQAVQVVDLVTMADPVTGAVSDEAAPTRGANRSAYDNSSSPRFADLARRLSRLAQELPMTAGADSPQTAATAHSPAPSLSFHLQHPQPPTGAESAENAVATSRLLNQLLHVKLALAATPTAVAPVAGTGPTTAPWSAAWAEVDRNTRRLLQLQHGAGAATASAEGRNAASVALQQAIEQARQAQLALFNQALSQHKRFLTQRHNTVQRQQVALLAALALLSAAALALAAVLVRQLSTTPAPQNPPPVDPAAGPPQQVADQHRALGHPAWTAPAAGAPRSATQVEAVRLMDRLRTTRGVQKDSRPGARLQPEDTLPPERS